MPNTESLANGVKSFLKSHHMLAYDTWIEGCVDYFKDTNSLETIQSIALEQWLLHDLKEICPGSLPANLGSLQKTVLNGYHVLQINSAMDISVPAYQQYLKMKKTDIENIKATMDPEEKISSKRMLKLDMTDGKQTIAGMEYETINKLKGDIKPGSKILIKGPVQCRQGMLLLTDATVEILNGEVPEMAISHSLAAQVASKLGLSMVEEIDLTESSQTVNHTSTTTQSTNNETNRQTTHHEVNNRNREILDDYPEIIDLDDYVFPQENIGKRQLTDTTPRHSEKKLKVDSTIYDCDSKNTNVVNNTRIDIANNADTGTNNVVDNKTDNEYPDDDELAEIMFEDDEYLREIEDQFEEQFNRSTQEPETKGPVQLATEPFVYIKQINDLSESEKSGNVFRVKAQILTVLTKLKMISDKWNLKCKLTDGTGCIDVEFSSDILSGFLGYTPQDKNELIKTISANPEFKNQFNAACKKTTKTLETLYNIIELTMFQLPMITRIIDFNEAHVDSLKERLNASGL